MKVDILTLFPEMFDGPFSASIIKRAIEKGILNINTINFRDFTEDKHRIVDDYPYGGGAGMVLKPEPIYRAIESLELPDNSKIILMSPQGKVFSQYMARELAKEEHLVIICGHYEGVDERVKNIVNLELSIGDYVLTGGEVAAAVVVDAVCRLIPGVLGAEQSLEEESFSNNLLEYPQYTRPRDYNGMKVPDILLSGDHEKIKAWRYQQALLKTISVRPDLLKIDELTPDQRKLISKEIIAEAYIERQKKKLTTEGEASE